MKKINSLIITRGFPPAEGGIETYMYQIASKWSLGESEVICKQTKKDLKIEKERYKVYRLPSRLTPYWIAFYRILVMLFKKCMNFNLALRYIFVLIINRHFLKSLYPRLEVLFDYFAGRKEKWIIQASTAIGSGSVGIFGKILFNYKFIVYIHGSELIKYQKRWNYRRFQKFILRNADLIIANSHYTKDLAVNIGIDSIKIKVINLGAEVSKFYPDNTRSKIYAKYNIPLKNKLILTISHLIPRKGNDMVIASLPTILKFVPDLTYLIVGNGFYKDNLRTLVKNYNVESNVKFAGYIQDKELADYMNACDIFVMPNRKEGYDVEGFGIVFLEANACKKPVIAGNSGGAVDAVINGETGYLVDPNSKEDISEKIIKILTDSKLKVTMGDIGYKRIINDLNWKQVISKIEKEITKLYD